MEQRGYNGMNDKNRKNKDIGCAGEELAALLLLQRGYRILARNFACRWGEIDIIAEKEGVLHFVEVKTRLSDTYGADWRSTDKNSGICAMRHRSICRDIRGIAAKSPLI